MGVVSESGYRGGSHVISSDLKLNAFDAHRGRLLMSWKFTKSKDIIWKSSAVPFTSLRAIRGGVASEINFS